MDTVRLHFAGVLELPASLGSPQAHPPVHPRQTREKDQEEDAEGDEDHYRFVPHRDLAVNLQLDMSRTETYLLDVLRIVGQADHLVKIITDTESKILHCPPGHEVRVTIGNQEHGGVKIHLACAETGTWAITWFSTLGYTGALPRPLPWNSTILWDTAEHSPLIMIDMPDGTPYTTCVEKIEASQTSEQE